MHSLARKLDVTLPNSKTPAKPVLTHAIVVAKLQHLDTSARLSYDEEPTMGLSSDEDGPLIQRG